MNYRRGEIQKLVADQPNVRLVSLTMDPRTDTPPVRAQFATRFQVDINRWLFLTGDRRMLYPLIEQSFLGPQDPKLAGLIPGDGITATASRSCDPRGELRQSFDGKAGAKAATAEVTVELSRSFGWHDLRIRIESAPEFGQRFAGRVETGREGFTDPLMGRVVV